MNQPAHKTEGVNRTKTVRFYPFVLTGEERDEETCYGYCNEYQPHAEKRMFDHKNGMLYDMRWDEAGNLGQISVIDNSLVFESGRFLYWTEDNRMHSAIDDRYYSYYVYDHGGERRIKLTGENWDVDVNADVMTALSILKKTTLYPSAYLVVTDRGYTNHYYAGGDRVAARIGGGGLDAIRDDARMQIRADSLFIQSTRQVQSRELVENDLSCILESDSNQHLEFGERVNGIPRRVRSAVEIESYSLHLCMTRENRVHDSETADVYYYHSDHLGSASWISNADGVAIQHLQYLPFGESYINQRTSGYSERFTFTGKEKDEETGYGYFGARYMDHELTTMWLSVDPMADKYPSISPYAYCAWNPIKLVDPDGNFPAPSHAIMVFKAFLKTGVSGIMKIGPKNILKMCWGASIVADVFHSGRSQVHLDNFNNQNGDLTSAYNNAISDYHNALSDGDYVRAGEALHTVADFYAHSDYVEKYDEFSKQKELSSDIKAIPTFSDAQENAEFMSTRGGSLKTGYWPDRKDDIPNSHEGMSKDTKRYLAGQKKYRDTKVNRHEAAQATAQKALDKIVGDE